MQLDSHRNTSHTSHSSQLTTNTTSSIIHPTDPRPTLYNSASSVTSAIMPCSFASRCTEETVIEVHEDGTPMESWSSIRRHHLRMLRKQTRHVILLMALMEAMRVGPMQIVYAGKQGYAPREPQDFGIAYNVGYFISWLYVCAFMVVFVPLFSWWIPNSSIDETKPSFSMMLVNFLKQLNLVLLPFTIAVCLVQHAYYVVMTVVYVDSRRSGTMEVPTNTKKNWLVRLMLVASVGLSLSFGYGAFQILGAMDLAHVKTLEYYIIVVPVQINLGLFLGSAMQWRIERRIEKMVLASFAVKSEEEAIDMDEKQAMLIEI